MKTKIIKKMKRKQLLTAVLLLVAGTAMAQNALQVEDFTLTRQTSTYRTSLRFRHLRV